MEDEEHSLTANQRVQKLLQHLSASTSSSSKILEQSPTLASDDTSIGARAVDLYRTFTADMPFSAKRNGGHLVAKVLEAHGVKFIFTLSGGHISPILCASEERGIRIIDVRHEVTSVFAADAVARLTGTCGVAAVTAGPGITNTITALKNAQMAESPLILLGGAAATLTKGRGALQDVDQMSVLKSVCKFSVSVTSARDIVPALRRAFREALSGVPGPCFVELPLDVLYPITEAQGGMGLTDRKYKKALEPEDMGRVIVPVEYKSKDEYLNSLGPLEAVFLEKKESTQPWVVDQFMKFKLRSLFAGAWDEGQEFGPLPIDVPQASSSDLDTCVQFIKSAKRPVMLLGSQSTLGGPENAKKLAEAVEALGIPCFLGGMARGLLGANSKTQIRQNRGGALKKADVIILAGAICDFRLGYGRDLPASAKIVTINRGREGGTMNMGMFWNAALVSVSDPGLFVRTLASRVGSNPERFAEWRNGLKQAEIKKDASNREKAKEPAFGRVPVFENGPTKVDDASGKAPELLNPLALCLAIEESLPDNAILVADGGDFVATASYILKPRGPLMWLDPGAFGTLGVGGGFALGAKLACPDKEIWLIWGDGSSGYSIAEMDTFTKHKCPIISVIGNDAAWTQIEREQVPMFKSDAACALKYLDYDTVARGYGADGVTIKDPKADLKQVIAEVREKHAQGVPMVINALIGRTNFREGSISV